MSIPGNPDFSFDSKKRIARAVRRVEGIPGDNSDVARPAFPRGGGGLPQPQQQYVFWRAISNGKAGYAPAVAHPPLS